uniref:Adenomatous polyposis coli protein n=2 Tax=Clytia hemisphaerica TaxID=252671 RepID=A0A7M5XAS1_9CNID
MGSRIPSSERINLSPLCMSAVPSGIQTPVEPGTGQKPLPPSELASVTPPVTNSNGIPSATPLQQLPGHDVKASNRGKSILEKFKGNEQYKPAMAVQPSQDSVKDFTGSRWIHSEMGSRIPSSEMISLSPLTMSGIPSGIQTPAEPNTGCIPLSEAGTNNTLPNVNQTEISSSTGVLGDEEFRPNSSPGDHVINKDGVKLRQKRQNPPLGNNNNNNTTSASGEDEHQMSEYMNRMKISDVPRFDYVEEDSVKNYGELSSTRQSYENLNYNGAWSNNTSGLVTPCDHGSICGGIRPYRPQPPQAALQEENDGINPNSDLNESEKPKDEQQVPLVGDVKPSTNHQPNTKRIQLNLDTTVSTFPIKDHSQPSNNKDTSSTNNNNNNARRRNSTSSLESAHSNRTDISTVVNAPMSMHNTAPASPDPDGSEISDSTVSENDESAEGTAGYAPKPSDLTQPPRWHHTPDTDQQPSRMAQQNEMVARQQSVQPPQNDFSRKNLIQMAKEQFPKQQTQPPLHGGNHPTANDQIHHHMLPPSHPSQQRFNYSHHHQQQHGPSPHYGGGSHHPMHQDYPPHHYDHNPHHPSYPNYDRGGLRYGYSPNTRHPQQPHPQAHSQQHRFKQPLTRYPSSGGSHDNPDFPMHGINHMKSRMNNGGISGPPHPSTLGAGGPRPGSMDMRHNMGMRPQYMQPQQHGQPRPYMQQHPGNMPPSRPPTTINGQMNSQTQHDFYGDPPPPPTSTGVLPPPAQQQPLPPQQLPPTSAHHQHQLPNQPQQQQPPTTSAEPKPSNDQASAANKNGNRTYSVTSLEPNRASPPQNDTLDTASVVSFASMPTSHQNMDTRVDMMSSLLSMLGTHDHDDLARTLLAMSSNPDSCVAMRQSQCVPLLIKLLHTENKETGEVNWGARQRAGRALHNIVHSGSGDRRSKREVRVLHFLEIIRKHTEDIMQEETDSFQSDIPIQQIRPDHGPGSAVAAIMKLSFDEEHKLSICELGGLQSVCELLAVDYRVNKDTTEPSIISLRKYIGMILTNLTYKDAKNKAVLGNMHKTLLAVIGQLRLTSEEDLVQVFAVITQNISWRPDERMQQTLKSINAVRVLMMCIQQLRTETCIRSVLSAVWNLSAHNSENKEEICRTPGSLKYLTYALSYRSPTNTLKVIENAGGILRNISSHIAINPEYRRILRQEGCLQTLVSHLRFPSTRVVSNACGVLWNISARFVEDQEILWDLGAVSILKTLINSKHTSIAASSTAALRNLLAVKPGSSGTDTESQLSYKHRTNSLPMRGQFRRGDKKYRSAGAGARKDQIRGKNTHSHDEDITTDRSRQLHELYDDYPPSYRDRTLNDSTPPIFEEGVIDPPPYGNGLYEQHSISSEKSPSQYFFPAPEAGRLPMSAPMNRRQLVRDRDSSSSCSSFSPNDGFKASSARKQPEMFQTVDLRNEEKPPALNNEEKSERGSPVSPNLTVELNTYDDCKLSVVKDAVMIYQGTPKLPIKASIATKDGKQKLLKLTSKMKRQKKSLDSLSSRDSLNEKSDVDGPKKKEKETAPKETFRTKTKSLKQRLLNKSHSSDLAFDKNVMKSNKRSPFDIYSMSNFPDRVASDQCLSMTDRYIRDMNKRHHTGDIYHGSWSSCDVTRDEPFYPNNGPSETRYADNFPPPSPQLSRGGESSLKHNNMHSHTFLQENSFGHGRRAAGESHHSSHHPINATSSVEAMHKLNIHNDSAIESDRSKTNKTKKSLLKNPLKKKSKKKTEEP